ncbi:MAG TPA: hypothetical protein VEZ17_02060, partial [Chitinophagaceae bacterium]|nr:hypothetical protein [Chitinophagaceae bacterium]
MLRHPIYVHEKTKRGTQGINWRIFLLFFLNILTMGPAFAISDPEEEFEEISISLSVSRIGNFEVPAVILGQQLYLPVRDIFDFLKIQN